MPRKTRKIRMEVLEDRTLLNASPEIIASITSSIGNPSSDPDDFFVIDDTMYFTAFDVNNGREVWKSDGTSAGTVLVKDIRPGSSSSSPLNFTEVNGTLFFSANDGTNGYELWKSDGTSAGTMLVKDINPGSSSSSPSNLTEVNGTLFFMPMTVPTDMSFGRVTGRAQARCWSRIFDPVPPAVFPVI